MLSRRGPILIVLSLLLAVGAAWVANRWLVSQSEQREATPGTVPVATAAIEIPFGTKVEAAPRRDDPDARRARRRTAHSTAPQPSRARSPARRS